MKYSKAFVFLILVLFDLMVGCTWVSTTPTKVVTADTTISSQIKDTNPWKVALQGEVQHSTAVAGFLNDTFGITAGGGGKIYYTTDGGKSWSKASNFSWCRFGLDIVDKQVAWHCGNGGHVRVSKDGGYTWQAVTDYGPNEPNHCRFLSFMDDKTGWIATPLQLGVTKDGGITWKELTPPEGIKDIAAIALRTVTDGYLLDTEGTLFITQDAGETWSSRSLGLYEGEELDPNSFTPVAAMRFLDTDWGLVALSLTEKGKLKALVMRTVDGGLTWKRESVPVKYGTLYLAHDGSTLTVVDFVNAKQFTVLRRQEQ